MAQIGLNYSKTLTPTITGELLSFPDIANFIGEGIFEIMMLTYPVKVIL